VGSRQPIEGAAISLKPAVPPEYPESPSESVPAIVLCQTVTGIATVRALAQCGVEVHACLFRRNDPVRYSRYAIKVPCYDLLHDGPALVRFLIGYAAKFKTRPVVFPTGDAHALLLAKHAAELNPHCRIWQLPHGELGRIVNKDRLYEAAREAGVPTVPGISAPTFEELLDWSKQHAGPYILKPSYEGVSSCNLRAKNLIVAGREQLLSYVRAHGAQSLVVQRVLRGGDGNIFDCYGLCDRNGRVVTLTSHRRIRQEPPDFGATGCGEIPASLPPREEELLFAATERLFRKVRYHGIFGIEWLREQTTGNFYLIDFNARPFLTIGHLHDCGVNLPLLAHKDLTGQSLADADPRPAVSRKRWVYFSKDIESFRVLRQTRRIGTARWLASVAGCRSFAYCSWRDPVPGLYSLLQILGHACRFLFRSSHSRRAELATDRAVAAPTAHS
jgi:predicted ATP-grasp superfamily ATP-dependent carboligase